MFKPRILTDLKTYNRTTFMADLFAGITVGVVALPLSMAFAIASGLPPERGIFTAIVAGLLISALGGSNVQVGGPTGAFVIIVAGIATKYGYEGLVYCTLIAGVMLLVFGFFRMGGLIKFIPFPVTTGFTSGIAVVIFSTQIKDFFGLTMPAPSAEFFAKWGEYFQHSGTINLSATALGIGTIAIIVIVNRKLPRLPAMLIAMVTTTVIAVALGLDAETIGSRFGDLPRVLPSPSLPSMDFSKVRELLSPAFTVAMLAAIESLLSATVADGMTGSRHRPDTELIAQGTANIASVIFGGIPATGAIARTATNIRSGAKTPVAGIIHALTLAALLLALAPLAKLIPLATLAGILVVVSYNMSEMHNFAYLLRGPRSDAAVLIFTFLLTILVDLTVAVQWGIILASLLFIRRMSEVGGVDIITRELTDEGEDTGDPLAISKREVPEGVTVFEIQGPFFFGAADKFKEAMRIFKETCPIIILRMRKVPAIDATGLHTLREFQRTCKRGSSHLILSGVEQQPMAALKRSGLWEEITQENIHTNIDDALNRARALLGMPPAPPTKPNGRQNGTP